MKNIVVFDLDGVITSEEAYWVTAGLVLHELLYSPRYWNIDHTPSAYRPAQTAEESYCLSHEVLPEPVIISFKARSINSNWDTCYTAVCICLIDLLARLPDSSPLLPLRPWETDWIAAFRQQLAQVKGLQSVAESAYSRLTLPFFQGYTGLEFIKRLNAYASEVLGHHIEDVFARYSPSWTFCQDLFQEWYLGEPLYSQEYGHTPAQLGKPGCIHFEKPLLPVDQMSVALETLRKQGYTLGIATGRPGQEAILPLKNYRLYSYFDESRIVTHAEVALAEARLHNEGNMTSLVKPHPYQFLAAADPKYQPGQPPPPRGSFVVVGDTPSDVMGGRAAGAITVAVLTGARTEEARSMLEQTRPAFVVEDMTKVPALLTHIDDLATIQQLQFSEREKAELLLQRWFARHMDLWVDSATLMPRPVSLNSFNGVYRVGHDEYFFKTHVEDQGILKEYYHAELLHNAGYNIVMPLRTLHEQGQQMVVYPVVRWPVMFDLMRAVEMGNTQQANTEMLVAAEKRECERLLALYQATLDQSSAQEHAQAPIHQLFWHRLTGGRLKKFYAGKLVPFPTPSRTERTHQAKDGLRFEELLNYRWTINGMRIEEYGQTLGDSIERAKDVLNPMREAMTVIGHGDAHFGNVFLEVQKHYLYFDPAFAGRHSPILDIVKPFFHNVFATWMYFPRDVVQDLQITVAVSGAELVVEHNYALSPLRQAILETKIEHLLRPLIAMLRERDALPADWSEMMRLALMCCPLLTINLLDTERVPAVICWLGLSQVMQMANLAIRGG